MDALGEEASVPDDHEALMPEKHISLTSTQRAHGGMYVDKGY